jgi:hypothetical protein
MKDNVKILFPFMVWSINNLQYMVLLKENTRAETKIFVFAKIPPFSHDFRFSRKWKKPFSFQP